MRENKKTSKMLAKEDYYSTVKIRCMLILLFFIISVILFLIPKTVSAATKNGMSYTGSSYYAINTYGVNMRDAKDNLIVYISSNQCMKVLGVYSTDTSRAVVEYKGKIGHVLKSGLKNVNTKYSYTAVSGGEYIATNNCAVNFRDENYNKIQQIPTGKEMTVLGIWSNTAYTGTNSRAVVVYDGMVGTVLNSELTKKNIVSEEPKEETTTGYWAWTNYGVNMRKDTTSTTKLGELIEYIPPKSFVWVKGINKTDSDRCNITFNGSNGTILKGGLQKVNSNEIIPYIEGNDSYKYAITTANNLNMRKNIDADNDGQKDLIVTLKKYTSIYVLGVSKENKNRLVVVWDGKIGIILTNYIEAIDHAAHVSITLQKTTVFKNGKIVVYTDCVTGKKGVYDTDPGKYEVGLKDQDHEFTKWGYSVVSYWISFDGNNGFHDATGRSAFGGDIYINNGSHGCVNLPLEKAKEVYENVIGKKEIYKEGGKKVVKENDRGTTVYVSAT